MTRDAENTSVQQETAAKRQEFLRPVVGVPDRHSFYGEVKLTYYGGEIDIDVGGTDLVEFLTRMEGRRVHISVERWS